ncbi:MAG: S8 family serine peptidase [Flavobacteriales bacterium]|nr:S8 family serine peptidase [Flavobacteriales bacterium]
MDPVVSLHRLGIALYFLAALSPVLQAQTDCAHSVCLAQGYSTAITSVSGNADGTFTIVLTVANTGAAGCKKLNQLTVQADSGTYSNVSVQLVSGAFTYASISMGPDLPGTSVTGFRINNTNGIGNGHAATFNVTYTLTGLQDQQVILKASHLKLTSSFSIADFQAVLDCQEPPVAVILPYFEPYANKSYDIIGVELTSLYHTFLATGTYISDDIFQILGSSVRVSIQTQPGQHAGAVSLLTTPAYGLVQELNDPANNQISGTVPILNLLSLNQLPTLLVSARPIYPALHNAGLITSQGDTALRSFRARGVYGVDGQGVKVGVLSDSYNTILGDHAGDDVLRGDLPGAANPAYPTAVQVLQDYPFGTLTDEGRAMLQIVHDIAPGAELAFRTGFLGPLDMANGIRELEQAGCDVIVDDISYISEPFFRDGLVAQAVDQVTALGVSYFSAAGNFGTNSWQGVFDPVAAPAGVVGQAHNFAAGSGGTDMLQGITLHEGEYTVVFQWDDGTPGTTTNSDFDIYLANTDGSTLFGFNRKNIGGEAMEVLPFVVAADSVQSNIMIVRESGTGAATLKYIVYRGLLEINEYNGLTASTLVGQANAAGAIAVGAVLYANTPEYSGITPTVASFSSRGGTSVNGLDRSKPDICAPNGVNTSVELGGVDYDGDGVPNFFGTSAAAPHAAGVAALLLQARTKYYGDVLAPGDLRALLRNTALDMGTPGHDVATGAGFILADSALMGLANPAAYLHGIQYDTTLTPGVDTLQLTIFGEYLGDSSTVWLDGVPLTNGVTLHGDTALVTIVDPFVGLYPEIQVYNPPMEGTNGLDGGLSNPLYFTTKPTILVRVDNKTKTYGEVLPAFTAVYTLESVDHSTPLDSSGLTQDEVDRIHGIDLTTIAGTLSNVGIWGIAADPTDPLNPDADIPATDPLDRSILQRFNIVFDEGLLTIDPAGLTITPRDTTFVYNDSIAGITFNYVFNAGSTGSIGMSASDSLAMLNAVRSAHGTALVNAAAVVRGTALVNSEGDPLLTDSVLGNFSFMISQAVRATRGTALVNGELIDPAELLAATTAIANAPTRLVRGTALVNGYALVRGTALVNEIDPLGNITNTVPLVNSGNLVNSSGILNASTITLNSNTQTLVILGDSDIAILSGDSTGGVVTQPVNLVTGNTVGTHLCAPGTFLTNNFNVGYGLGHITILPDTAQFTIAPGSLTQTFDGAPKPVAVTVLPDSVAYTITYNGSATPPVNAGSWAVHVQVDDPNYVGSLDAILTILPATAQFTLTATTQTYDATPQTVEVDVVPSGVAYTVTYDGSSTPPLNAGTYAVAVTTDDPNFTGSASTTLVVLKASATATTGTYVIDKGAPLPAFTATFEGLLQGQTASVVSAVSFATSPDYTGYAGVYAIIVSATAANYDFIPVNGTLYVNPAGPGTKQVKPRFICRETLSSPGPGGFMYIARFAYENNNPTPVYIPVGPDNSITGAAHLATGQPVLFLPGGGTWDVPYNNMGQLTWQVRSNKKNYTTGSIQAHSSNVVCDHCSIALEDSSGALEDGPRTGPGDVADVAQGMDTIPGLTSMPLHIYPNPSTGKVFMGFLDGGLAGAGLEVYNAQGARCAVGIDRISDRMIALDFASWGAGLYVVKVINGGGTRSSSVIIE